MSNRQDRKQDQRMKATAKLMAFNIKLDALDMLNAIRETWEDSERQELAAWLLDKEAGPWG